jgi:predicted Ser/Thr protein kinase
LWRRELYEVASTLDNQGCMTVELGSQFAGYRLDEEVGRGGMGVVYRATELALDRPVALKVVAPELAGDPAFRERFLRESRLAASIDHPGILPVYAAGEADGELYLAMRYVAGTDLRTLFEQEGTLAPERALPLLEQVAEALDAAHARGLVHRDVKPGNVLVDSAGHCYLCDFGLTKRLGETGATTVAGRLVGTLDYLAPEQIRQDEVDGRADQYALACVLYECLAGKPPFRRVTEAQTLWGHMQEAAPPLPGHPELDEVLDRGLAKDPDDRFDSCVGFVNGARSALGFGPSRSVVLRRRRRLGRRLILAGAALVAVAIGVAALVATLGSAGAIVAPPNSMAAIDPVSRKVVAAVPVGNAPTSVAASDDWAWVINSNDGAGTISRIDPRRKRVVSTFSVGGTPIELLAADGSLWVGTNDGHVFQIEPSSDLQLASWRLPNAGRSSPFVDDRGAGFLAYGADRMWAASFRAISRIDPASSELVPGRTTVWGPLAYGFRSLWTTAGAPGLFRLAPTTLRRQATVELPIASVDVTVGLARVWLPDDEGNKVWEIDPEQNVVEGTYDTGGRASAVAVGANAVWSASSDGSVVTIDPSTGRTERISVGGTPTGIAYGGGLVWTSVQ